MKPEPGRAGDRGVTVSVVAPCFNEEEALPLFLDALLPVLDGPGDPFEVILVDDGSTDRTFEVIRSVAERRPEIRGIQLSRNFGHQAALTAGLDASRGEAVVTMDADLQHPPAVIPALLAAWREGAEVVLTERRDRDRTPFLKRLTSAAFYRLLSRVSKIDIRPGASDFRLLDRRVVRAFGRVRETHRLLRGLVLWSGFRQATVPFEVGERAAGTSKYDVRRMMNLALDGIFSFTTLPLRTAIGIGLATSALALLYLLYALGVHFLHPQLTVPGWTSILGAVLLIGGVQLTFLGILGEYVVRIYEQVKGRPLYLVRRTVPEDGPETDAPAGGTR
jgi:glycosyltransferase involved in cell wall biosynthesis